MENNAKDRLNLNAEVAAEVAEAILEMFQQASDATIKLQSAVFECRHGYLKNCSRHQINFLLNSERKAKERENAELQEMLGTILEKPDSGDLAEVERYLRYGDSLLSRVLADGGLDETWTTEDFHDFLRDFIQELTTRLTEYRNSIEEIAAIPDAAAQRRTYANFFSKILTNEIKTHVEITSSIGEDILTTEEAETVITKCLELLYDSELQELARLLPIRSRNR